MNFTHHAVVPAPLPSLDLSAWIFTLTDAEYRACASGHHAMGIIGGTPAAGAHQR